MWRNREKKERQAHTLYRNVTSVHPFHNYLNSSTIELPRKMFYLKQPLETLLNII